MMTKQVLLEVMFMHQVIKDILLSLILEFPVFKGMSRVVLLWKTILMRLKYNSVVHNILSFLLIYDENLLTTVSSIYTN